MTPEDKQLLLQDLCARLPYGVICDIYNDTCTIKEKLLFGGIARFAEDTMCVRPYLRPLSSMTEEESGELSNIISEWFDKELFYLTEESFLEYALSRINYSISPLLFDWLNAHHFDYRNLIERGLAIAVTEDNNPYKE